MDTCSILMLFLFFTTFLIGDVPPHHMVNDMRQAATGPSSTMTIPYCAPAEKLQKYGELRVKERIPSNPI